MGFEPTTFCLGSKHSTPELRPHTKSAGFCISASGSQAMPALQVPASVAVLRALVCIQKKTYAGGFVRANAVQRV
jgi:hypothetical protein